MQSTGDVELGAAVAAIDRWVEVLNHRGDAAAIEAAIAPRARLLRMGVWDQAGTLAETFLGHAGASDWLSRAPDGVTFWRDGEVERDGAFVYSVRYGYRADDFVHGGAWLFEVDGQGRVRWLLHRPDLLSPDAGADKDWSAVVEEAVQRVMESAGDVEPRWTLLDHTADRAFELVGPSEASVLEIGARCIVAQLVGGEVELGDSSHVHVAVSGLDARDRLVKFLNEVLVRARVDGFLTARADVVLSGEGGLKATLHGERDAGGKIEAELKAVTDHELEATDAGWRAVVVLEV